MSYLLDTHVLLWAMTEIEQIPMGIRDVLTNDVFKVSVISYWEMVTKKQRARAPVINPTAWWDKHVVRQSIEVLSVRAAHVDRLDSLPLLHHRDPFDRMLVAQALAEGLTLITKDAALAHYGVPVLW